MEPPFREKGPVTVDGKGTEEVYEPIITSGVGKRGEAGGFWGAAELRIPYAAITIEGIFREEETPKDRSSSIRKDASRQGVGKRGIRSGTRDSSVSHRDRKKQQAKDDCRKDGPSIANGDLGARKASKRGTHRKRDSQKYTKKRITRTLIDFPNCETETRA